MPIDTHTQADGVKVPHKPDNLIGPAGIPAPTMDLCDASARRDLMAWVDSPGEGLQAPVMTPGAEGRHRPIRWRRPAWSRQATATTTSRALGRPGRLTEQALIRAARGGSEEALETLFRHHWGDAHRAAYLIVRDGQAAEDIAQDAFLAAIRALDRFDLRRRFAPWLHRIVVNRAIDWSRRRKLRAEVSVESLPRRALPATSPQVASVEFELRALLGDLSPEHRAVIVLRYLLEYTPGEIGAMLDLPRGTVNSRLRRALDQLGTRLEGEGI